MPQLARQRSATWKWTVCGLLFLATLLNYMDRQTLAHTKTEISGQYQLTNEQFGDLEFGFGLAFAVGSLVTGWIADRVNVRWLYPIVLIGWSLAGVATSYATGIGEIAAPLVNGVRGIVWNSPSTTGSAPQAYLGLLICRVTLGLFEAGQWPCALIVTQRILSNRDRTLGNSLLQSGASIGAILTPVLVYVFVSTQPDAWPQPFRVIGLVGIAWVIPWLLIVRSDDLRDSSSETARPSGAAGDDRGVDRRIWLRRFIVLAIVVTTINVTWQFFRFWHPTFLREFHGFSTKAVNLFIAPAYYCCTDVGCVAVGFAVKRLATRGWDVHRARVATFGACALLVTASAIAIAMISPGPLVPGGLLLIGLLMVLGFGALGLFPTYYSFCQELSWRHQGKVAGVLSAISWSVVGPMQKYAGRSIDETGSYAYAILCVGLLPLVAWAALALAWGRPVKAEPLSPEMNP